MLILDLLHDTIPQDQLPVTDNGNSHQPAVQSVETSNKETKVGVAPNIAINVLSPGRSCRQLLPLGILEASLKSTRDADLPLLVTRYHLRADR